MTSVIQDAIILVLDAHGGELQGTEELALMLNARNKTWFVKCVRVLESNGLLEIIPPRQCGRGHHTIYKRNRNQPGLPRRKAR